MGQSEDATAPQESENKSEPRMHDMVADALAKVCLRDAQRNKVAEIGKTVAPKVEELKTSSRDFMKALVEQFKSGSIDKSALKDKVDEMVIAHEDAGPVLRKAIDDLHGILDENQRATFVDAIEASIKERKENHKQSWSDQLAKDLNLTDDQKSKVKDALEEIHEGAHEDHAKLASDVLDAFKNEDFSVDKVAPMEDVGDKVRDRSNEIIDVADQLVRILSPEQRAKIADKVESKISGDKAGQEAPHGTTGVAATVGFGPGFGWSGFGPGLGWSGFGGGFLYGGYPGFAGSSFAYPSLYGVGGGIPYGVGWGTGIW